MNKYNNLKTTSQEDHFGIRVDSFHSTENDISKSDSHENKLSWLRSQIIGENVDFESPFGKRRMTYADHTASGRCLHYIENYIINNVLPFYGMFVYLSNYVRTILLYP